MARPLGPLSRRILSRLSVGPCTAARMAAEFGLPVRQLVVACYVLRTAGLIRVDSTVSEGGAWRAVAVYATKAPEPSTHSVRWKELHLGRRDGA